MATSYTTLLGLALPVTGELSGTWGDTVNNYLTNYLDSAVAGALTVTGDTTLTKTTGSSLGSTSSQYAIIIASPASANITITAPAASKIYTIINTSGTYTVTIRGTGPTTGVTLGVSEKAQVAWNGSDFVKISNISGAGVFSSITNTGLTSGRVVYSTTGGLETDSANLTFNGTTLTANTLNLTNALGTTYGGTGLTSFTANGVVYASSSSALTTGSALTFDGTTLFNTVADNAFAMKLSGATGKWRIKPYANSTDGATIESTNSAENAYLPVSMFGSTVYLAGDTAVVGKIGGTEQMRLTGTGLGIGTTSPNFLTWNKAETLNTASGNVAYEIGIGGVTQAYFAADATNVYLGVYANKPLLLRTNNTTVATFDTSGNLGLGVTPSAWQTTSNRRAFELGYLGSGLYTYAQSNTLFSANAYFDGAFKYAYTGFASSYYAQVSGEHRWNTAPSGTAGNAITFTQAMTLDASGNLGIGTTSPAVKLDVSSGSAGTAILRGSYAFSANNYNLRLINDGTTSGYLSQNPAAGGIVVADGMRYYGGGPWTPDGTSASSIQQLSGNTIFTANTGLTAGTNFTPTERMRLDASGNLGLGVTPSAWGNGGNIQLNGANIFGNSGLTYGANAYYNGGWKYITSGVGASYVNQYGGAHQFFNAPSGTAGNAITFTQAMTLDASGNLLVGTTSASSSYSRTLSLANGGSVGISFNDQSIPREYAVGTASGNLTFRDQTANQERARIDLSGNLFVGQTARAEQNSDSFDLDVQSKAMYVNHASGTATGTGYLYFGYNATNIGSITQSGTTAVLYNVTSDQRLKENIVDAPEFGSVIDSLQVRSFDWKTDQTHQRAGFVAQELVTVAPEAVHQPADPDEMMAVDYSKLVPMLVKEIQSLRIRITQLEAK